MFNEVKSVPEVCLPNISSIDYPERQLQTRRNNFQNLVDLFRRADQVQVERGCGETDGGREIRSELFKIGSDKNPEITRNLRKSFVRGDKCLARFVARAECERRLVKLNPDGSCLGELAKNTFIDRKKSIEQRQRVEARLLGLAEEQEGYGTKQDGPRMNAHGFCFEEFSNWLQRPKRKGLFRRELRNDVVVVRIKPLCHFHSGHVRLTWLARRASCHREIRRQIDLRSVPGVTPGNGSHHRRCVQNVIVKRKII